MQDHGTDGDMIDGEFGRPSGVCVTSDWLLVADTGNARIVVRAMDRLTMLPASHVHALTSGSMDEPVCVTVCPTTGKVLVVDRSLHQVIVLAGVEQDVPVHVLGVGHGSGPYHMDSPTACTVVDSHEHGPIAAAVDCGNHRVVLYRLRDGVLLGHVGGEGRAPGRFVRPWAIAVVPSMSCLAVTDEGNRRVQLLTLNGCVVRVLDGSGLGGPLSSQLRGITFCSATLELLVANTGAGQVLAWPLDGDRDTAGHPSSNVRVVIADPHLPHPSDLAVFLDTPAPLRTMPVPHTRTSAKPVHPHVQPSLSAPEGTSKHQHQHQSSWVRVFVVDMDQSRLRVFT